MLIPIVALIVLQLSGSLQDPYITKAAGSCLGKLEGRSLVYHGFEDDMREHFASEFCIWKVKVPENYIIIADIIMYIPPSTNCTYGYLEFRDGDGSTSPLLGRFCGYRAASVFSSGNSMTITFKTEVSEDPVSYLVTVKRRTIFCGGDVLQDKGVLYSPNYPEDYFPHTFCIWRIKVPENYTIAFSFLSFNIQRNCSKDYLEIRDGKDITSPLLGRFCGYEKPKDIMSTGSHITVTFKTDYFMEYSGFAAFFTKELDECKGDHGCEHECINTVGDYKCECKIGYILSSDGKTCEDVDECTLDHGCKYECNNIAGSYRCKCQHGYEIDSDRKSCKDKDECAINNGGCQHICKNTVGSYICSCHAGFILQENNHTCQEGDCYYNISSQDEKIVSPYYPDYYPKNKECAWLFVTTPGHRFRVVFQDFDLEFDEKCSLDHIAAYNGDNDEYPSLGKFCGTKPPIIESPGNKMYLVFRSDENIEGEGFTATHKTVCGGELIVKNSEKKHIYSHAKYGFATYDSSTDCDWIVSNYDDRSVGIHFIDFDVEDHEDCYYDYVQVFDGKDDSAKSLGKFCGNKVPPKLYSSGDSLMIRFKSDKTENRRGFAAEYGTLSSIKYDD